MRVRPAFMVPVVMAATLACAGGGSIEPSAPAPDARETARTAFAAAQPTLADAVARAEHAVATRDGAGALGALAPVREQVVSFDQQLGSSAMGGLAERFYSVDETANHIAALQEGILLGREVVGDKKRCDTGLEVSKAWEGLKLTRPDDPERKEALLLTAKLEKCRARIEKELSAGLRSIMVQQRAEMASKMERTFLDQGMDVRVTVSGASRDRLKISWILMSRVAAHQVTDGGSLAAGSFLGNLQRTGFRKVTFSDSYSESWTYELTPPRRVVRGAAGAGADGPGLPPLAPGVNQAVWAGDP